MHATILLADDEPAVRQITAQILTRRGYRVLVAESGSHALRLVDEHAGSIDLLLTDVMMPEMNGPELARVLVNRFVGLPVIFYSGFIDDASLRDGLELQSAKFLGKPFTISQITRLVSQSLSERLQPASATS